MTDPGAGTINPPGALANTARLVDVHESDFDAVFYPGGHGPLWDLARDQTSISCSCESVADALLKLLQ